jgi:hypothetical protein
MPVKNLPTPLEILFYRYYSYFMTENKAAGPKTELIGVSQRMQQSIEDLIASLTEGVGDCLQIARGTESASGFDDTRSSERRDAVNIASTAAEVLAAIAKLKGGFSHDYRITRASEAIADERALREEKKWEIANMVTQSEVDDMSEKDYVDYQRMLKGLPPKYAPTFWKSDRVPQALDRHQLATLEAEVERGSARPTPSPSRNRGSNTEAMESGEIPGETDAA